MFAFIFKSLALAKHLLKKKKANKQESFAIQKLYSQTRL